MEDWKKQYSSDPEVAIRWISDCYFRAEGDWSECIRRLCKTRDDKIERLKHDIERHVSICAVLATDNDRLRTERDALKQDAKRYRWIIKHMRLGIGQNGAYWSLTDATQVAPNHIGEVDATIDAALRGEE